MSLMIFTLLAVLSLSAAAAAIAVNRRKQALLLLRAIARPVNKGRRVVVSWP